jgi:tetratricopeptide (TPR) repeat protein
MPAKTEKDLSDEARACWLKAVAAIELRNFGYAISLLQGILKQEPEFLIGRQLLRRAEVMRQKGKSKRSFRLAGAPVAVLKAQRALKKSPAHAVELVEKILESNPFHKQANLLLKTAAVSAGWLETGVFAVETLLQENPRDIKLLHDLAALYHQLGENERAVEIYNRINAIDATDAAAMRLGKEAAARASMKAGGWATAESYRDLIKDKETAVSLEQQSRMQLAGEALERQIAETYARHQAEPQNVDHVRRLGALSEQKEDFEAAEKWYRSASDLAGIDDLALARKISDLRVKQLEQQIAELEEFVSQNWAQITPEKGAALAQAKQRRAQILIEGARERVERNPADLQLRFELGEHLMNAGNHREAVPELQRARQNPNARLKAMNALGCCYRELGMLDLAAKQLEEARREILGMDPMKKEIVYNLGIVYEQMTEPEKSLACMKEIYEADYGYKDVARRVESSYGSSSPGGH